MTIDKHNRREESNSAKDKNQSENTHIVPERVRSRSLNLIAIFLFGTLLYVGKTILLPLVAAILLSLLLRPFVRHFESLRIPRSLSSIIVMAIITLGAGLLIGGLSIPFQQWAEDLPAMLTKTKSMLEGIQGSFENVSRLMSDLEQTSNNSPQSVQLVNDGNNIVSKIFSGAREFITATGMTLVITYFVLAGGEPLICKLMSRVPHLEAKDSEKNILLGSQPMVTASHVLREIESLMSFYLGVITIINLCLGICVFIFVSLMQLPHPLLWGAMFFLLNFIPYIGPFIGIVAITVLAFSNIINPWIAVIVPVVCLALTSIEGNVVTPTILGRTITINPLVVFVWTTFTLWFWGVPGGLIAVPLLVLLCILAKRIRSLNWLSVLLAR